MNSLISLLGALWPVVSISACFLQDLKQSYSRLSSVQFKLGPSVRMSSVILKPLWMSIWEDAVYLYTSHQAESPVAETLQSGIYIGYT